VLESACTELAGGHVTVRGAGRTDAGVHAQGQVASITINRDIDGPTLVRALNWRLPVTIRVLEAGEVPPEFDARFDARVKAYRYRMWNAGVLNPFERAYAWHLPPPALDVAAMAEGARLLEGLHDFAAFQGTGSETHGTERTIFSSRVIKETGGKLVTYDVSGDGFLRYMVRNIVGSLVEVGRGRHEPQWMADLMSSGNRSQGGQTAPAHGLFLMAVRYE
jgi:tRNA pseudouridine38-40 synthase